MAQETSQFPSPTKFSDNETHKAVTWQGTRKVQVDSVKRPLLTDPTDAIVKVTSTAICGSDLHFYEGAFPGMKAGDVVGHEFMGIVAEVGSKVQNVKKGDRVISAFDISCGDCNFCNREDFSLCDNINPNEEMEGLYGDHIGGIYGYSHLAGGFSGGQAEYVRAIHADTTLLKLAEDTKQFSDIEVLLLSDIYPTAWHANELGKVGKGDSVAIWGSGPVGILAARLAQIRGAKQVILIDSVDYRLQFAKDKVPGVQTINFKNEDVVKKVKELSGKLHGVDVGIDAVGMHYAKTATHKIELAIGLESDSGDILAEIIQAVRKGGRVSIVGAYAGTTNHFPIGAFMEKQLTMAGGQTPCQKYWPHLLKMIKDGTFDPSFVITHKLPLDKAAEGYKIFNDKTDNCIKVVLTVAEAPAAA